MPAGVIVRLAGTAAGGRLEEPVVMRSQMTSVVMLMMVVNMTLV